jgi:hypothetical protein
VRRDRGSTATSRDRGSTARCAHAADPPLLDTPQLFLQLPGANMPPEYEGN